MRKLTDNNCSSYTGTGAGVAPFGRRAAKGDAGAFAPGRVAGLRPVRVSPMKWLWTALLVLCLAPLQAMAVSNGNLIVNVAELHSEGAAPIASSVTVTVASATVFPAPKIELLKYAPTVSAAVKENVDVTWYRTAGDAAAPFERMAELYLPGENSALGLPSLVPLVATEVFHQCETVFVRVTDARQNLDFTARDTVTTTITDPTTHLTQVLRLTETGTSTGVFTGYIVTTGAICRSNPPAASYNGFLPLLEAGKISASFIDESTGQQVSRDAVVDPFGIVFNSVTGKPVDGVVITLLDEATGLPAQVFGDDGVSDFPATVTTGGTASDASGRRYDYPPGQFRFPFVNPGKFRFVIETPRGYSAPSVMSDTTLQALGAGPFALALGSRLEPFVVNPGPALHIDIPLDPLPASLWLRKTAGKGIVAPGDFLPYQLDLQNNQDSATAINVTITDTLPPGFRYRKGSSTLLGKPAADPAISGDGRTLTFSLDDLPPKGAASLRFVVEVAAGARVGVATNIATAHSFATTSNTARAAVQVQSDFLNSRSLIMGRVSRGPCHLDWDEGVEGVRIYLEDGTFVNTDKRGMFHVEGVTPGSHVVQLDLDSLPEGVEVYSCADNTRFAGRSFSQFVDVQGGTMWRADFRVGRPDDVALYEKRVAERAAAALRAEEKARKITEERLLKEKKASKAAAAAAKEQEDDDSAVETEDWPENAPPAAALEPVEVEAPVDDWAEPVAGAEKKAPLEKRVEPLKGRTPGAVQAGATGQAAVAVPARGAATLELRSALEQGGVVFAPTIEVSGTPLRTQHLEVELPHGLSYRPGSATMDGRPLSDPKINGRTLAFTPEPQAQAAKTALRFATDFAADAPTGEYITRAVLIYATDQGIAGRTPYADNLLVRIKEEERSELPTIVVHPTFDSFEDRLSVEDKKMLDETVLTIRSLKERGVLKVRQLLLVGHTDNVPIARRSRQVYRDNTALSSARAKSVAIYLKDQLGLAPAQLSASGKGGNSPVASNRSAEGRAANRRVEVIVLTQQVAGRVSTRLRRDASGVQRALMEAAIETSALSTTAGTGAAGLVPAGQAPRVLANVAAKGAAVAASDAGSAAALLPMPVPIASGTVAGADSPVPLTRAAATAEAGTEVGPAGAPVSAPAGATVSAPAATVSTPAADSADNEPVQEEPRLTTVGILSPADGVALPDPVSAVRVVLDSKLTPQLLIDGTEIPADRIGFTLKDNRSEKTLYSYIGVNFGAPGVHVITLVGRDPFGIVRLEQSAKITRVGAIARIRLAGAAGNVADGKTPVRMKLELYDAAGAPFRSPTELQIVEGTLKAFKKEHLFPDAAQDKVERVLVDAEGYALFQPVIASGLYRTVLAAGKATVEAETYVQPKMREWILVGLGEGTVGYNAVSGHMENLRASGADENLYEDGRIAFYGKGTIKGEWLMTLSYDSAKARGYGANSLFQTINPESFYTLYGDASQQQYDAASARKLYLKIERNQFNALFGDFDTGLTVTELSRYSRRLNGVKAEWQSANIEATVFGADTTQAYARDEIRGDGTSGLYHLSRKNLVINSDKITIQVRDRFRSEIIVSSQVLNRFVDYSIDYDTGALFFKGPIQSRDENFNPIFIIAEYETANLGADALTYGGRAGAKLLDNRLKAGFSYLHEGQVSGEGNSYGIDTTYKIAPGTTFKGEAALTSTDFGGTARQGGAWLAELHHETPNVQGRAYFREQDAGFGLGQQNGSETGTRKFGVEAGYKLTEMLALAGQGYRQYNLSTGAVQDMMEARATSSIGPYSSHLGVRHASDDLGDGSVQTSNQLTLGGSWLTLNKRLTLRADRDQSIGGNSNVSFPTRTVFGADFKVTEKVSLFGQQEYTSGSGIKTDMTRLGFKTTPWAGGAINSTVERDLSENSDRLFALFGLKQSWKLTEKWSVDAGLDRSETIRKRSSYSLNVNVPPASGATEDFTAVSLGSTYTEKKWNWNNRLEYRDATSEKKWGLVSAYVGEPKEGWGWSGRFQLFDTRSTSNGSTVNGDLRLGLVYRPLRSNWIILDRVDLLYSKQGTTISGLESRRVVNNLSANYKIDRKMQVSLQYGSKYVLETIDNNQYSGFTDVAGFEGSYDLTKEWDIGLRGSVLHSWGPGQLSYSAGPSIGYNVMQNAWISLGYNFLGFADKDFSAANYTAQGPHLRFRFKFDQNSVRDAAKWLNQN